ncbi:glycosyltransferase [Mycobacterium sp.]|uniref:glycosyltransferase n=1 Tax=Mycobacterium sp. TaxID=1785 RepID=UPI0031CE61EB
MRTITALSKESLSPRVVVVSNVGNFGGGGAVGFRDMVSAIRERRPDLDVVAVCPGKGTLAAECARNGVRTKIAWMPGWAFLVWGPAPRVEALIGALLRVALLLSGIVPAVLLLVRERPRLVLTNTMVIPAHAIAAKLLGIPHYWMVREFGKADHQLWFLLGHRRSVRLIGRLSESVICNSYAVEKAFLAIDSKPMTYVVHPVVDTPLGSPPKRLPGEPMRTVLVGYLSHAKGQRLAIEAIAIARKAGVDIELTLVGSGNQKPFRKLAQCLGVDDLVTIDGPTRDLGRYWAAAHVGLMCSECEAFGRVSVEAMRAGLPVCGTNTGGTPEIIDPGVNGLLGPAGDATALAANLMALESNEDLRRSLAVGAIESAERFQRDRHDDELAAILGL